MNYSITDCDRLQRSLKRLLHAALTAVPGTYQSLIQIFPPGSFHFVHFRHRVWLIWIFSAALCSETRDEGPAGAGFVPEEPEE